jgi:hypothetical protein
MTVYLSGAFRLVLWLVKDKKNCFRATTLLAWLATANPGAADERSDRVWSVFRSTNPLHIQAVGLSDASADGERVMVIAEPPPLLPKATFQTALAAVFGPALKSAELKRNRIGLDGWAEDVIAILSYPQTSEGRARLDEDMTLLARRLFGTAYKFAPLRLAETGAAAHGAAGSTRLTAPPSLDVSAAELNGWLFKPSQAVTSLETGQDSPVDALLVDGRPGVYLTRERGLVLLLLPRDEPINEFRAAIREFAVDTDAIVGAVAAGERRLLVVGRERDTSLMSVPPLRAETILALAATQENELGQSYERTAPFAGRLDSGDQSGRDWAPVYLSRDLFNSEFGSLLNITDQMLKGWSEAGTIRYVNFNYSPPAAFPFPQGVKEFLKAKELTFNWNTTGVGAVVDFPQARVFTILRTGSLPVSYCPGETCTAHESPTVISAEEKAYNWFSGLRDPYLGRVVQYSSIYQIFRAFPVQAVRDEAAPVNFEAGASTLTNGVQNALEAIIAEVPSKALDAELGKFKKQAANLPPIARDAMIAQVQNEVAEEKSAIAETSAVLRDMRRECAPTAIGNLAELLANRQAQSKPILCKESFKGNLSDIEKMAAAVVPIAGDPDAQRLAYMAAAKQIETGFIKTPSIVLSWADNVRLVGGHNLYSWATRIETTTEVPAGQVRIIGTGDSATLRINPADSSHSAALARAFERKEGQTDAEMTGILGKELANDRPVRLPGQGLALTNISPAEGRGLSIRLEGDVELGELGQRPALNSSDIVAQYRTEATARNLDLFVARNQDGFYVLRYAPPPAVSIVARSESAMLEAVGSYAEQAAKMRAVAGEKPVRIGYSADFSIGEVRAINMSQEMRASAGAGGGWLPPRPPGGSIWGHTPEPRRPNGFFFVHSARSGEEQVGYAARRDLGDTYTLEARSSSIGRAHELLLKQVNWEKGTIKEVETVKSLQYPDLTPVGFEVELPLTDPPFLQWTGLTPRKPLLIRIISYFRRQPAVAEREMVKNSILRTLKANADAQSVTGDGMLALKAELLRDVKADALEFYVNYGDSDLQLVKKDPPTWLRANVTG